MSGTAPEGGPVPGTSPVAPAVLLATGLVIVLATWAAAIGPDRVFGDDPVSSDRSSERVEGEEIVGPAPAEQAQREEDDDRGWGSTALLGLEVVLLLGLVYLLVLLFRWVRLDLKEERRWRRRPRPVAFEVLPATPEQAAEEIVRDADRQLALLREGSPRNGIVACWHRFEVQARAARIGREPWETSAEFTLRVLDLVAADEHSVAELAELYREARFSDHEMREPAREAAVRALERIHRGLGARPARSTS